MRAQHAGADRLSDMNNKPLLNHDGQFSQCFCQWLTRPRCHYLVHLQGDIAHEVAPGRPV